MPCAGTAKHAPAPQPHANQTASLAVSITAASASRMVHAESTAGTTRRRHLPSGKNMFAWNVSGSKKRWVLRWVRNVNRSLHFAPSIDKLAKMGTISFFHIE